MIAAPPMDMVTHRLILSAAEFAVLRAAIGLPLPPGFDEPTDAPPAVDEQAAVESLIAQSLLSSEARRGAGPTAADVHPSVAANLLVLARPQVLIRTDVTYRDAGLLAVHAIAGQLGASLFAADDGGTELSMFAATDLRRELSRVVAQSPQARSRIDRSLSDPAPEPLAGLLSLAALAGAGAWADVGAGLAGQVERRTHGMLRVLITGPLGGHQGAVDQPLGIGQVVWLATDTGWVGVRPDSGTDGQRLLSLEPVTALDLGIWVAPYIAAMLA